MERGRGGEEEEDALQHRCYVEVGRWRVWLEAVEGEGESSLRVRMVGPHDHHSILLCDAEDEECSAMFKSAAIAEDYESIEAAAYESVSSEEKAEEKVKEKKEKTEEEEVERPSRKADERTRDREQRRRRRRERRGAAGAEKSERHARRGGGKGEGGGGGGAHRHRRHRRRQRHDDDSATTPTEHELSSAGAGDPAPPVVTLNPSLPSRSPQATSELDHDGFPTLATLCIRSVAPKLAYVESLEGIPIDMRQQMLRSLLVQRRHVQRSVVLNQDEDGVFANDDEAMPLNAEKAEDMREEREEVLEAMLKLSTSCDMSELEFVKLMEVFCDTRRLQRAHGPSSAVTRGVWVAPHDQHRDLEPFSLPDLGD